MENCNHRSYIQRLDSDTYLDKRTGEIKDINHMTNREQDKVSILPKKGWLWQSRVHSVYRAAGAWRMALSHIAYLVKESPLYC